MMRDGTLIAVDVDLGVDTGAYFTGASIATTNAVNSSFGGYRVPNFRVRAQTAYTNKVPAAMFRNTGKNQTAFGIDCAMDNAARRMGLAPIDSAHGTSCAAASACRPRPGSATARKRRPDPRDGHRLSPS